MDPVAFIQYLRQQRLVTDYVFLSAGAVFLWDYILTLHLEIKLVWFSRWSYTKVLFLLVRYMSFVSVFLTISDMTFPNLSVETCRNTLPVEPWFLLLGIFFSEVILAIRTWAVWRQNTLVGIGLAVLTVAHLVVECVVLSKYVPTLTFAPPPYPGFRGCLITNADGLLWINYTAIAVVEAVVLTLMVISAYRTYKRGGNGKLSHIIHRDGIQLYAYLLCISVTNVVIMKALPFADTILLSFLQEVLYPVLTTRIVLNIRDVGTQGIETELHTAHRETLKFASPHDTHVRNDIAWPQYSMKTLGHTTAGTSSAW